MSKVYTGFDCVIKFRCSASLRDAIRDGAKACGMDVSTYIRAALWTACPRVLALSGEKKEDGLDRPLNFNN